MIPGDLEYGLTQRAKAMLALAGARGLRIMRRGMGWHIEGRGVNLSVADLDLLRPDDLEPPKPGERSGQAPRRHA